MKTYGLKRNYNVSEDACTKYDGWKSSETRRKTAWKKCLHRSARRTAKYQLKIQLIEMEE